MDSSTREQIERARQMTGEQKVRESLQLFDRTRRIMLDGLRDENPGASQARILELLGERLSINRSIENRRANG
jgi:hypothetical protein